MSSVATDDESTQKSRRSSRPKLSASDAAAAAIEQISGLTAKKPDKVTSVEPDDEGWLVEVEIVEDRRVPSSSDVLALYEVELNPSGELQAYRRTQRYVRGRSGGGKEAS
jgi:hypothetical protein